MNHHHPAAESSLPKTRTVRQISKCTIKPHRNPEENLYKQAQFLTPWDIAMLSVHHIQKGLLFSSSPNSTSLTTIIDQLKNSLSLTLTHFFPLSGRLSTQKQENPPFYSVSIDCSNPQGAEFIHSIAENVTINDVLSPIDIPAIVNSFFPIMGPAVNHDGHTIPLLTIQVTELVDGYFLGCTFNHVLGDGTSYWHFFNSWAEICRSKGKIESISNPPITKRWFLNDKQDPTINLPFTHSNQFIDRFEPPLLRERMFHFSKESLAKLKARANQESKCDNTISSFQALSALMWRSITRARCLSNEEKTSCRLATNNRLRLNPPLSLDYFGNCIQIVFGTATAGELLSQSLGWAAQLLNEAVNGHSDEKIRGFLEKWMNEPMVYKIGESFDPNSVMMGSSPRFDMYGCEFGWGKAVAARSGFGNKFSGKVSSYPGREGGGSVDLEVCLPPESMSRLELDVEFMDVVSFSPVMN